MKRLLAFVLVVLFLITTPLYAKEKEDGEGRVKGKNAEEQKNVTEEECPEDGVYKNHGEYVSCVAKIKPGGAVVSEAARSDIGKKNKEATPSPTVTPTISPIPTLSPTPTATPSPTITPSVTPTPTTPISSPIGGTNTSASLFDFKSIMSLLSNLLESLRIQG